MSMFFSIWTSADQFYRLVNLLSLNKESFYYLNGQACEPFGSIPVFLGECSRMRAIGIAVRIIVVLLLWDCEASTVDKASISETSLNVTETTSFCGGFVTHSFGNITSPKYPSNYDDMLNCKWHFLVQSSHRILFQFYKLFSTEHGYDRVSIYDGISNSARLIVELSGNDSLSQIFTTTSNTATVRFTTDNSLNFPGFALYYSTDPIPACGGVLYTDGTIETPDFPAHYPSSAKCRWVITTESDKRIEITFESFQTEPGRDFLTIMDPLTDLPLLIHSGFSLPDTLTSPSNQLILIFQSDHVINQPGFELSYKII